MSDKIVPGLTTNDIIEFLDENIGEPVAHRPEGFGITAKEYAEAKGCSDEIARNHLNKAVKEGLLEKKQMVDGSGTAPFVYYKADS